MGALGSSRPTGEPHAVCDVSILMPSYNSGLHISDALSSALNQDDVALEVVLQDAGSADQTVSCVSRFSDSRLRTVVEPDAGQSDALRRALLRAHGEFVMWLNADDMLTPGSVKALLDVARLRTLDVVHGNYEIIDAEGATLKTYTSGPLERDRLVRHGTYIFSGALLIRRGPLMEVGGFDPSLHYCMDYDLLLRLAGADLATGHIGQTVAQFRRQPDSKTETAWLKFVIEHIRVERRHGMPLSRSIRTAVRMTGYHCLLPLWRSRLWTRVRPQKHLGGSQHS